MSVFTQNMLTEKGKKAMFETWKRGAPAKPTQGGWFGSLYREDKKYKAPIEDYNEEGAIATIGVAEMAEDGSNYQEEYW